MTLPDIWDIISAMQSGPTGEQASPYLTELQARISFSLTAITFVIVGLPLAIQTQRRETSVGVVITFLIVLLSRIDHLGAQCAVRDCRFLSLLSREPDVIPGASERLR
jgi:lipopolysaccharide export LptBFGC system permease protein LptF